MLQELFAPLLVQVGLTFVLLTATAFARVGASRRGEVKLKDIALSSDAYPRQARQVANSYANQFELPILFYLAIVLALLTRSGGWPMPLLAWAFVASRLAHAFIHVTTNNVIRRFYAFSVGVVVLAAMWILLAVRLLGASG